MDTYTGLDDFLARARARLDPLTGPERLAEGGDLEMLSPDQIHSIRRAGVLIGIKPAPGGATVILTERPQTMAKHPGQVAFPGGKVDPTDHDEVAAAVREAEEEVGLPEASCSPIGRGAPYYTGTGFRIVPVIAVVPPGFEAVPEPGEVDEAFETPLDYLMTPANHLRKSACWQGETRIYYEMPYGGHRIWGVTAGIIRNLYRTLYA